MKPIPALLTLLALSLLPVGAQSQKLDGLKDQLKSSTGRDRNLGGSGSEWFWIDLFFNFGFWPTYGLLFGFENEPSARWVDFNDFPYADGNNGLYLPTDWPGRGTRTQVTAHLQTNEDAVLGGYAQVRFSPNRYLTFDLNHLQLFELLEDQPDDRFAISNFNVQVNRVRHPKIHLWWGGGLMLLHSDELYGSPALSGGFTWFFKKPLSLHAETQFGRPNGVFARQHQARVQYHLDRFMFYAGYQGFKVGEIGIPSWTMGSGIWF